MHSSYFALAVVALRLPAAEPSAFALPPSLGINTHYHVELPGETAFLRAAGFKFVRTDLSWAESEPHERNNYNFTSLGALLRTLAAHGLRYHATLDYTNALYDNGQSPFTPDGRAGFARFVVAAAAYARTLVGGATGILWELYNEPDLNATNCAARGDGEDGAMLQTRAAARRRQPVGSHAPLRGWYPCANASAYALLAVEVGAALKRAYPDEIYIGPAVGQVWSTSSTGLDTAFLNVSFAAGALRYWDAVSIHPYTPFAPEVVSAEWALLRGIVDAYAPSGKGVALLSGEWGYSSSDDPQRGGPYANETLQAKWLGRMFLTNVASGVNLSVWYDWRNDGPNASYVEDNFGIVRAGYLNATLPFAPKPAYAAATAINAFTDACSSYTALVQLDAPSGAAAYASYWACPGYGHAIAVWAHAEEGWSAQLNVSVNPPSPRAFAEQLPTSTHGQPQPPHAVAARGDGRAQPCFTAADYLGEPLPVMCSSGGFDNETLTVNVSSGITYLRPLI